MSDSLSVEGDLQLNPGTLMPDSMEVIDDH